MHLTHQLCVSTNQLLPLVGKKWLQQFLSLIIHLTIIWTSSITFPKIYFSKINSDFTAVAQSFPTNCTPMDCSMPGIPVHHQLSDLLKVMSTEPVISSNHLILCYPPPFLPSIFPKIRVFFNESALHIRQPKYWSFSFIISPSNEYSGLISLGLTGWIFLQSKGLSRVFSNTTVQKHQFLVLSFLYGPILTSIHGYCKNHSFD